MLEGAHVARSHPVTGAVLDAWLAVEVECRLVRRERRVIGRSPVLPGSTRPAAPDRPYFPNVR